MPSDCHVPQKGQVDKSRCAVGLKLRSVTHQAVASAAGITIRHLHYVLAGKRPLSRRVAAALRHALGSNGWDFVTHQTDTLCDERFAGDEATDAAA